MIYEYYYVIYDRCGDNGHYWGHFVDEELQHITDNELEIKWLLNSAATHLDAAMSYRSSKGRSIPEPKISNMAQMLDEVNHWNKNRLPIGYAKIPLIIMNEKEDYHPITCNAVNYNSCKYCAYQNECAAKTQCSDHCPNYTKCGLPNRWEKIKCRSFYPIDQPGA